MSNNFPSESNYSYAGNNPIFLLDKDGKYKVYASDEASYMKKYPLIMKYLANQVEKDMSNSTKIISGLKSVNPTMDEKTIKSVAQWGKGPTIVFKDAPGEFPNEQKAAAGYSVPGGREIHLNAGYASYVEDILKSNASQEEKDVAFTRLYMTLIHETAHDLDDFKKPSHKKNGAIIVERQKRNQSSPEIGVDAERAIWGKTKNPIPGAQKVEGIEDHTNKYTEGVTEDLIKTANQSQEGKKSLPTTPKP